MKSARASSPTRRNGVLRCFAPLDTSRLLDRWGAGGDAYVGPDFAGALVAVGDDTLQATEHGWATVPTVNHHVHPHLRRLVTDDERSAAASHGLRYLRLPASISTPPPAYPAQ